MKSRWLPGFAAVAVVLLFSACFHDNNYLQPEDFVRAMRKEGLKIERVNRLDPRPLGATEALEARVAGSGIGIYKFDRSAKVTKDRLEKIRKAKKIYFNGIPYPVYEVYGSFFVVGLDKNPEKHKILEVLRDFR
ncbi:MAG: hypothetical protein IJY46_01460 [Lentisphaeria bacterium]|nr:hypothetical protein [Lentisphaeria bacterium]